MIFKRLLWWIDPMTRTGPETMAVDECLLELVKLPVLRVYRWPPGFGSVGYFGKLAEAQAAFPGLDWVRRWTGGGTVDHRADWTYTLVAPAGEALASARGAESYQTIHSALAATLRNEGIDARLSTGEEATGAMVCFENPVSHDLIDPSGHKLAGAGQRRTARGLLHQGSVAAPCDEQPSLSRTQRLASLLADNPEPHGFSIPLDLIEQKVSTRYGCPAWTTLR
jgi:lipoate-protein ligase A